MVFKGSTNAPSIVSASGSKHPSVTCGQKTQTEQRSRVSVRPRPSLEPVHGPDTDLQRCNGEVNPLRSARLKPMVFSDP